MRRVFGEVALERVMAGHLVELAATAAVEHAPPIIIAQINMTSSRRCEDE